MLALGPRMDPAFERLYGRHVHEVYRYALALLPSEEDAERVTLTTFCNAYRAFAHGALPDTAGTWLIEITHRLCRERAGDSLEQGDDLLPEESPMTDDVRRALRRLAFEHRATIALRVLEGRSCEEMAEILDLSAHAVERLLFCARRALREELERALRCRRVEQSISRFLDGELDRTGRRVLRRHLSRCAGCRAFGRSQRIHGAALRRLASVAPPSSLSSFSGLPAGKA